MPAKGGENVSERMRFTLGQIRALRRYLGMTQTEFAAAIGYSAASMVSLLERGKIKVSPRTGRALARLVPKGWGE